MTLAPAPTIPATGTMRVLPWPDPVIDALGFDPRSTYVETYWLGTLGPVDDVAAAPRSSPGSTTPPTGFTLDLPTCARELGLGDKGGRSSPFARALGAPRAVRPGTLAAGARVRSTCAAAYRRSTVARCTHLARGTARPARTMAGGAARTPAGRWHSPPLPAAGVVARRVGEDRDAVERQLLRWGYHPALAYECAGWALAAHRLEPQETV